LPSEFDLPGTTATVIATSAVGEQRVASAAEADRALFFLRAGERLSGEGGGIVRNPEKD
jgi:hypothetical protein